MSVRIDPENHELTRLLACIGDLTDKSVLEIGCGNGRLTHQYAHLAHHVVAIDPDAERIADARNNTPSAQQSRLTFHATDITSFTCDEQFDRVLLSWSL